MAEVNIAIKDHESANAWLNRITLTNEQYRTAMKEASEVLQDTNGFAEGTMVDEFVDLGSTLLRAAENTFSTINKIADTVNAVIGKVTNLQNIVTEGIKIAKKIFGS